MPLAVICTHFNPSGFHAQRRNLLRFLRQLGAAGIEVFVAELAYQGEPYFLPKDPSFFRFRTDYSNVLWHKENLINLAVKEVPLRYDKLAWIDPDLMFMSSDWSEQAEKSLDSFAVVQLFSEAWWTDHDGRCYKRMNSTMADGRLRVGYNHPGFAWAARRDLWVYGGGLCDLAILGGGDALLASACLGDKVPLWFHYPNWEEWTHFSRNWIHRNGGPGFIAGTVVHEWHGSERERLYVSRHSLLEGIDIAEIVHRREDGLIEFAKHVPCKLRNEFREYFIQRNEDGQPNCSVSSMDIDAPS